MSIRARIFWWLLTCFISLTVVLFGAFYTLTSRLLYAQTDREIELHASAITTAVSQEIAMLVQQVFENSPGMLVTIGNVKGEIVASNLPESTNKTEIKQILEKSAGIIQPTFLNKKIGMNSMRLGIFPVSNGAKTETLVIVGHPTDVVDHALSRLVQLWYIVLLSIMVIAGVASWIITRSIVAPITNLTKRLESVSEANLTIDIEPSKTKDELSRLTQAFAHMMGRIRMSFERERQFIGEVAHELKTPLSIAKSKLELSGNNQDVLNAVNRVATILSEMLDMAWASAEQPLGKNDEIRLDKIVEEVVEIASALGAKKNLSIKREVETGIIVRGKRDKLFRVALNILDNAVKYSEKNGTIAVSLASEKEVVIFEVSNGGKGIAKADLPHVFERYYRGDGAGKKGGTGLGLAIVQAIVIAHGGEVTITSRPKGLTTVRVILPISS